MERILDYTKVDDFFKSLSQKHVDIKDYCGTSVYELSEKIESTDGIISPILVFFGYRGKLSGIQQRSFNTRSLSFSILYSGISIDNPFEIKDAKTKAEIIGLEVLSRINIQSQMPEIGWLYKNFEKESVLYEEIDAETSNELVGMEFHFDLKTIEPLTVSPEKWSDGDTFCLP